MTTSPVVDHLITPNNILDLVHVSYIHIFLPQFLTDGLATVTLFVVGHLWVRLGTLDTRFRDYFWHLWVGEDFWCLGHDGWLTAIAVVCPNIPLHLLHCTGELVRGSQTKI